MSNRQQRTARALAYKAATNQALWQKGKAEFLGSKWYYPLKYRLSRKFRAQVDQAIGAWYKLNLKNMADQEIDQIHDPAYKEMARAQRKIRKIDRKRQAREYWDTIRRLREKIKDKEKGSIGSEFDEFLKEQGIYDSCKAEAEQKVEAVMRNIGLSGQEK